MVKHFGSLNTMLCNYELVVKMLALLPELNYSFLEARPSVARTQAGFAIIAAFSFLLSFFPSSLLGNEI